MKMKSVSGVICLVADLEKSINFYQTLGFEFKKSTPGTSATAYLNWFWIELLHQEKVITNEFKEDAGFSRKGAGCYMHINVENVDDFHEFVVSKGLKPAGKPQDFPWGHREFVLSDPDGYKLVFFQKIT